MAYTSPFTFTVGAVLTAGQLNTYVRDEFLAVAGTDGLTHTGNWVPEATGTRDLGENSTPLKWRDLWLSRNAYVGGSAFVTGRSIPSSGAGLEVYYASNRTGLVSYDRTGAAYKGADYDALDHVFTVSGNTALKVYGSKAVYIGDTPSDPGANNLWVQGHVRAGGAGTAAAAAVRVNAEAGSGLFSPAASQLGLAAGGVSVAEFSSTVFNGIAKPTGTVAPRPFIPATVLKPLASAPPTFADRTIGSITVTVLRFPDASTTQAEYSMAVPSNYGGGSIKFIPVFVSDATSGNFLLQFSEEHAASGAAYSTFTTRVSTTFAVPGTAGRPAVLTGTWSSGLPTAGDSLNFQVVRVGGNASDTAAGNCDLIGFWLEFGS